MIVPPLKQLYISAGIIKASCFSTLPCLSCSCKKIFAIFREQKIKMLQ